VRPCAMSCAAGAHAALQSRGEEPRRVRHKKACQCHAVRACTHCRRNRCADAARSQVGMARRVRCAQHAVPAPSMQSLRSVARA